MNTPKSQNPEGKVVAFRADGVAGVDRMWDSQWVNVVNHDDSYDGWGMTDAIARAVKLTEEYMAANNAATLTAMQAERDSFAKHCELLTHKIITCGVAARHPDPTLSKRGAYAGKWDSPQAQDVRDLRDARDAMQRRLDAALVLIERIELGCAFPSDDVQRAVRDVAREAIAILRGGDAKQDRPVPCGLCESGVKKTLGGFSVWCEACNRTGYRPNARTLLRGDGKGEGDGS